MREIAVLDQITIDKIAAGEVVERPSSVVKELVENAIDAGASAVTVEIKDGGKTFLRITDNGSGIPKSQVPLAFLRHATSKIQKVEDLQEIASLGFRGEALSSISAVSQVELITKTASDMAGVRYIIEGGIEKSIEDIGAPEGTTFLVRNLFYNVPARSKFLKTAATEGGYISSLMEQMALSHPEVSFKYMMNGQVKLHTSGNGNQKDVIYQIYGRDITRELLEIHFENELLEIHGYIGKPTVSRGNRNFENYYINGRYVKNKILMRAIEDAYKGFLMQHQFPFVSLQIAMTGNGLDVNVHPAKMEVRFSREQEVYQTLYRVLSDALYERELIPEVSFERKQPPKKEVQQISRASVPEPFEKSRLQQAQQPKVLREATSYPDVKTKQPAFTEKAVERIQKVPEQKRNESSTQDANTSLQKIPAKETSVKETPAKEIPVQKAEPPKEFHQESFLEQPMLSEQARRQHKLIGQLFDTYWLVQYGDSFYIIDQHAAHEKILYERVVRELESRTIHAQYLSPPIVISLSMEEEELLKIHKPLFEEFGFELEHFGGREYNIRAVPSNLYGVDQKALFLELLGNLDKDNNQTPDILLHKLATAACKAAVKGNQRLSPAEADCLIDELLQLENPYHCPHGRPTIVSMTKTELEKKFRRIV
ncbi:MAG: DNA mismatch repair endonuclease MutL [Lachnospiraceae bacterium]|nr:DNA mismatch repair endonuclease MutL [Clostridiales bacterium]MDY4770366.1 DNA mismatch repair endonuclease MutL [Lachnospiraceae bacterium]